MYRLVVYGDCGDRKFQPFSPGLLLYRRQFLLPDFFDTEMIFSGQTSGELSFFGFSSSIKPGLLLHRSWFSSSHTTSATKCNGDQADQFPSGNLFVSVSEGLWDNGAACGRRYRLKCLSGKNKPCKEGTIDVRVVDFCSKRPCPSTIVLSNDAFSAISKSPRGKINVEYVQI